MAKVIFINESGDNKVYYMESIPRLGDVVPVFDGAVLKVISVAWFPELIMKEFEGMDIEVVITLG